MTTDYVITHGRYEEIVVPGHPLGRQKMTDSRSAAYPFRLPQGAERLPVTDQDWPRHIPTLDQGDVGSCEGDAEVGCAATSPIWDALPSGHPKLDQAEAYRLYALATSLDGYPGTFTYPPPGGSDTGTDSTSASKAAQKLGLIGAYLHAGTFDAMLQAAMTGPTNMAFDWFEGMDNPGSDGSVEIAGAIRGGHALCQRGVDAERQRIWLDQSWGLPWGFNGRFYLTFDQADYLLGTGGECVVPLPVSAPVPPPVPVPSTPSELLWLGGPAQALPGGLKAWCASTRTRADLIELQSDAKEWARKMGLS